MSEFPLINDEDEELERLLASATLDRLRAEHPQAFYTLFEADEGPAVVVFRRLSSTEFKRGVKMAADTKRSDKAAETIARDVLLHPQGAELEALREQCPGLDDRVAAFALRIAKGEVPEEAKKLRRSPAKLPAGTSPSTPAR